MPAYTTSQYFLGRIPDIATLLPGYDFAVAIQAAMSLYWSYFFPATPNAMPDEALLSERQKALSALRAVLGVLPVTTHLFTRAQPTEAGAGPATTKLEERNKIYRACMPLWATELKNLEAAEGIFFDILPGAPAFLEKIHSSIEVDRAFFVAGRDVVFVED